SAATPAASPCASEDRRRRDGRRRSAGRSTSRVTYPHSPLRHRRPATMRRATPGRTADVPGRRWKRAERARPYFSYPLRMATRALPRLAGTDAAINTGFFGHPSGLSTLFFTEMWERFSYYGMRAFLILYMTAPVAAGGLGFADRDAASIYGTYTGTV